MPAGPLPFQREPALRRLARRVLTVGATSLLASLLLVLLPPLAMLAVVVGLLQPRTRFGHLRTLLAATWAAWLELYGVARLLLSWLRFGRDPARLASDTASIQAHWTSLHLRALIVLYDLRFDVQGMDDVPRAPTLLLVRHTSMLDTILPPALLVPARGTAMRYVLKRELLADPCLDIAGNRIPNVFLDRAARGPAAQQELDNVAELAAGMQGNEALVIFPEGTRATASKRARVLAKLEQRAADDPDAASLLAASRGLRHLLPLKLGGAMALLRGKPDAEVRLVAHSGLEGLRGFRSLTAGALVRATVKVRFLTPAAPRPAGDEALESWLLACWAQVDEAVDQLTAAPPARSAPPAHSAPPG